MAKAAKSKSKSKKKAFPADKPAFMARAEKPGKDGARDSKRKRNEAVAGKGGKGCK